MTFWLTRLLRRRPGAGISVGSADRDIRPTPSASDEAKQVPTRGLHAHATDFEKVRDAPHEGAANRIGATDVIEEAFAWLRATGNRYGRPPDSLLARLKLACADLGTHVLSDDGTSRLVELITGISELFRNAGGIPEWYQGFLDTVPLQVQEAFINALDNDEPLYDCHLCTIKHMRSERSSRFFEDRRRRRIEVERQRWVSHWDKLANEVMNLPVVEMEKAEAYMQEAARSDGITTLYADTLSWPANHAIRVLAVEDVVEHAVMRTRWNNGDFRELARNARLVRTPITLLAAHYVLRQGDEEDVKVFLVIRTGAEAFLVSPDRG
jgi:hypothetical protein